MNKEELLEELKYNIPEDYIRGCDTSSGIGEYEIDTDSWQYQLYVYVLKLQNNWNELKKFAEDEIIECKTIISTILPEFEKIMPRSNGKTLLTNEYNKTQTIIKCFEVMLSKMQELENGKDENN